MTSLLLPIIYIAFISLGLPDSLLGSAWPSIYPELSVPVSYAGGIFMIISIGTVISSLQSDRLTKKFGTGKITASSVLMTAIALFGFSSSHSFISLCLWAIPYGLGAGSVDASLNNYVALHYKSRHMSWLHAMWGIGASIGPYIMSYALTGYGSWNLGYRYIAILQIILTAILILSQPLWKKEKNENDESNTNGEYLSLRKILSLPGAKEAMITFFCYCTIEQTIGLWASSYLVIHRGMQEGIAASFASMFFIGITISRFFSGLLSMKLNDTMLIRLGQLLIAAGTILLMLPISDKTALFALLLIGLGCAPVYPSLIHATPERFGSDKSQAIIGVQMASAYIGNTLMPPVFGLIANYISISLLPVFILLILILMVAMHEKELKAIRNSSL